MLNYKKIKATETEHSHVKVYLGTEYLGYYMPNRSPFAHINENWNFVAENEKVFCFQSNTEEELKTKVLNHIGKIPLTEEEISKELTEVIKKLMDTREDNTPHDEDFNEMRTDYASLKEIYSNLRYLIIETETNLLNLRNKLANK